MQSVSLHIEKNQSSLHTVDAELAALFGLQELRAGKHILRDEKGWKAGEVWVQHLWKAHICPSSDRHSILACVSTASWQDKGNDIKPWTKAVFVILGDKADHIISQEIKTLDADPLQEMLNSMPLLPTAETSYLDGIAYHLETITIATTCQITVQNPSEENWKRAERQLHAMATDITKASPCSDMTEYPALWEKYLTRS